MADLGTIALAKAEVVSLLASGQIPDGITAAKHRQLINDLIDTLFNVTPDWNAGTDDPGFISNKPTIPSGTWLTGWSLSGRVITLTFSDNTTHNIDLPPVTPTGLDEDAVKALFATWVQVNNQDRIPKDKLPTDVLYSETPESDDDYVSLTFDSNTGVVVFNRRSGSDPSTFTVPTCLLYTSPSPRD